MSICSDRAALWLRLSLVRGIGPLRGRRLVAHGGDIERFWSDGQACWAEIDGVGPALL